MSLLLVVFLVLCSFNAFCAANDVVDGEALTQEVVVFPDKAGRTTLKRVKSRSQYDFTETLRRCFQKNRNVFLSEAVLCMDHKMDNVYKAILDLRAENLNIVHNKWEGSFALIDGERICKQGSYELVLWEMFKKDSTLLDRSDMELALELSDANYSPVVAKVYSVKTLFKILFDDKCSTAIFLRRKKLWCVILQDLRVYGSDYYARHPGVQQYIPETDRYVMQNCWYFYKQMLCTGVLPLSHINKFLEHFKEGKKEITLQEIRDILSQKSPCNDSDVWGYIGLLALSGHTKNLSYKDEKLFLDMDRAAVSKAPGLLSHICYFFNEGLCCDEIAFSLHQKGHHHVKPWDVRIILNILAVCGRVAQDAASRKVVDAWKKDQQDTSGQDFAVNNSLRCLADLQEKNALDMIKICEDIDLIQMLKADLSEDYCANQARCLDLVCLDAGSVFPAQEVQEPPAKRKCIRDDYYSGLMAQSVCALDTVAAKCMWERQGAILHKLRSCPGQVIAEEELCGQSEEELLEDIDDLIYLGHNIKYADGGYKFSAEARPLENKKRARRAFRDKMKEPEFARLSVAHKTYHMCDEGYPVPLHRVALWSAVVSREKPPEFFALTPKKQDLLEHLMDKVVAEGKVEKAYVYKGCFPGLNTVVGDDVARVTSSLSLYSGGSKILEKMNKTPKKRRKTLTTDHSHPEVRAYFESNAGRPCAERALRQVVMSDDKHALRDLYRTIVHLRAKEKKCIVHNGDGFTFFAGGVREVKHGFYEAFLWRLLDSTNLDEVEMADMYMRVSDFGYNPVWNVVENTCGLKKAVAGLSGSEMCGTNFRYKVFRVMLQDGHMYKGDDYQSHPGVLQKVNSYNMKILRAYWRIYHRVMYDQDSTIVDELRIFLETQRGAFILDDIATFLSTHTLSLESKRCADAWRCLSGFMRSGYAGNIERNGVCFSWNPEATRVTEKREGLYEALLAVPEYCDVGFATFDLHKQGYMHIGPWDVYRLMDIFIAGGVREGPCFDEGPQQMWRGAYKDVSPSVEQNTQRRQWLEETGVLQAVRNGERFDVDVVLQDIRWIGETDPFMATADAELTALARRADEVVIDLCQYPTQGDDD